MEGLVGVPGTIGGALRMNAGAYGMQIGSYVREVQLYRAATSRIEILKDEKISFEYRHTSFAPDDIMLAVKLELPSKPYRKFSKGFASATKNDEPVSRSIRKAPAASLKIRPARPPAA